MENTEVRTLIDRYINWLRETISFETLGSFAEITTPFLDRHNDRIQIYVKREGEKLLLTDDSYTISDLHTSGLNIHASEGRRQMLQKVLNGFGVESRDDQILTYATKSNFAQKKHNLIQSILAINDLFVLSKPQVESLFLEDVENWLKEHDVRHSKFVKFPGKSGFDHNFDFLIPPSRRKNERIVKAVNTPNKTTAGNFLWAFLDVRALRGEQTTGVAILNDTERELPGEVSEALKHYEVLSVPWSDKAEYLDELAA